MPPRGKPTKKTQPPRPSASQSTARPNADTAALLAQMACTKGASNVSRASKTSSNEDKDSSAASMEEDLPPKANQKASQAAQASGGGDESSEASEEEVLPPKQPQASQASGGADGSSAGSDAEDLPERISGSVAPRAANPSAASKPRGGRKVSSGVRGRSSGIVGATSSATKGPQPPAHTSPASHLGEDIEMADVAADHPRTPANTQVTPDKRLAQISERLRELKRAGEGGGPPGPVDQPMVLTLDGTRIENHQFVDTEGLITWAKKSVPSDIPSVIIRSDPEAEYHERRTPMVSPMARWDWTLQQVRELLDQQLEEAMTDLQDSYEQLRILRSGEDVVEHSGHNEDDGEEE